MLSSVLRSRQAIAINIEIMRAFVHLRRVVAAGAGVAGKLDELERRVTSHDRAIADVFEAIRRLMDLPPTKSSRRIGFV